jgi:hypothetical protein
MLSIIPANYVYQPFLETVANNGSLNSTNVLYAEFPDDVWTGDIIVRFVFLNILRIIKN